MKKIVHITTVHAPFDQRIFHRECFSLFKTGYDVSLLAYGKIGGNKNGIKLVSIGSGEERKIGSNFMSRLKRIRRAFTIARKMNADLYHFHDPEFIIAGLLLKKITGARVIYDCHEDNVSYMLQKNEIPLLIRRGFSWLINIIELKAIKILDAIITADQGMRDHFLNNGAKRSIKVDNFPKLDLFIGKAANIKPKYDLIYHGTIPKYHLETCFAADSVLVKRGIKPTWLFIGKCSDYDLSWARKNVCNIKAEDRFTFKAIVPHEDIARWVRLGRIGIIPLPNLPKFHRNVPTKLFEFMALKIPVILSDLPPSRPYVGDGKCAIMVNPDSPNEYADAISYLLSNENCRFEMGKEGNKRVISIYNWNNSFQGLEKVYNELLT